VFETLVILAAAKLSMVRAREGDFAFSFFDDFFLGGGLLDG